MRYTILLLLAAAMAAPLTSVSQVVMYDVLVGGRNVGSVKVMWIENTARRVKQRIEAQFGIPFLSGSFSCENDFFDGQLKYSLTEHFMNGKRKESTHTSHREPQLYLVNFSGKETPSIREVNQAIHHTMTGLYYQEPANVVAVYSERYGQMCSIEKQDENRYGVTLPNGKRSIYAYHQGLCAEIQSELGGMKLRIVRRYSQLAGK